jgi:hypothetical protein
MRRISTPTGSEIAPRIIDMAHCVPLRRICRQGASTNGYNKHLSANGDKVDTNKEKVSSNAFKDVELVIETAIADKT